MSAVTGSLGGIAHRRRILETGPTPYELGRAVHDGSVLRIRRSRYRLREADGEASRAVRCGGALTGPSAARSSGWWALDDGRLHVAVAQNGARLRCPDDRRSRLTDADPVRVHWTRARAEVLDPLDDPVSILLRSLECQTPEAVIAMADSALNRGDVTKPALLATARVPARRLLARCDPRSRSGTESVVAHRLRGLQLRVRTQVPLPGVGRVDLLVGDRLIVECDSRAFRTRPDDRETDRRRDLAAVARGYTVSRVTYRQVFEERPAVERAILDIIRHRGHLASGSSRYRRKHVPSLGL